MYKLPESLLKTVFQIIEIFLLIYLVGCQTVFPKATPIPTATETVKPTATIFYPVLTSTIPPSPTPSPTPAPTQTPTPEFWVLPGTAIPEDIPSIRSDNAQWVSGLTSWKEPTVTDLEWMPPDYRLLTVVTGERIKFYDIFRQQMMRELYPQGQPVVDIAFNPAGNWLVSASRRGSELESFFSSLELWSGPDWKPRGLLYDAPRAISNLTFSPNGKNLAVTFTSYVEEQNSLDIWSSMQWQITGTVSTGVALQVAYAPGSRLLAVTPDRYAIKVWNIEEEIWQYSLYTSFTGAVTQIVFSPDGGVLASGHYDGLIRLWDLRTGEEYLRISTGSVVESLAFSTDSRLLASGGSYQDSTVRLWDAGNGALLRELTGHKVGVSDLLFSPGSQFLISASYDGEIRVWGIRP